MLLVDTRLEDYQGSAVPHRRPQHDKKEQTIVDVVWQLNWVCPKEKQEHGTAFLSMKELFAAMLSSGWSIAIPS